MDRWLANERRKLVRTLLTPVMIWDPEELMQSAINVETKSPASPTRGWLGRNWKWILVLSAAVLVLSRFTLHRGYVDEDKTLAAKLIEKFHERLNTGHFEEIYDDAHPAFRNALSKQEWLRHMQENRERYGLFKAARSSRLNVVMGAPVQIRGVYYSTFDKGEATELFSFAKEGHKVQLLIYGISPGGTQLNGSASVPKDE
jgi:hypothetical protein